MLEASIRLNQIVNKKDIHAKRFGALHSINNTFKRSTIYSQFRKRKIDQSYQQKLPSVSFTKKDLSLLLRHLFQKQSLLLPDRNLLRRILLAYFDEQLISMGSLKFINHLKVFQNYHNEVICPCDKHFYFLLKGSLIVTTNNLSYEVSGGQVFGEKQILANQNIAEIYFKEDTLLLALDQQSFHQFYQSYFQEIFTRKEKTVACIKDFILSKIPLFNKYMFLDDLHYGSYKTGQKIIKQNEKIKNMFFCNNISISNTENPIIQQYKSLGLFEVINQKNKYVENIYCMENIDQFAYISVESFKKYVGAQLQFRSTFSKNQSFFSQTRSRIVEGSQSRNKIDACNTSNIVLGGHIQSHNQSPINNNNNTNKQSLQNPEDLNKQDKMLRIRKVKLPFKPRKTMTQHSEQFISPFKFLQLKSAEVYSKRKLKESLSEIENQDLSRKTSLEKKVLFRSNKNSKSAKVQGVEAYILLNE